MKILNESYLLRGTIFKPLSDAFEVKGESDILDIEPDETIHSMAETLIRNSSMRLFYSPSKQTFETYLSGLTIRFIYNIEGGFYMQMYMDSPKFIYEDSFDKTIKDVFIILSKLKPIINGLGK